MAKGPSIAFVPWASAYNGLTPGSLDESRLKVATLYYDRLILPVSNDHLTGIVRQFATSERLSERLVAGAWASLDAYAGATSPERLSAMVLGPDPMLCWDQTGNIRTRLRASVDEAIRESLALSRTELTELKTQNWLAYAREARAFACSSTGCARVWSILRQTTTCALASFFRVETVAAKQLLDVAPASSGRALHATVNAIVPSVRHLPWEAVFQLRKDARVAAFRDWLTSEARTATSNEVRSKRVLASLWAAFEELKTTTAAETIKGIIGNLPMPLPVNPLGILESGRAVARARSFEKRFGWLMFLHTMKVAAEA